MTRYHRQVIFEPFGAQGQEQLVRSRVLICGCGALGGSVAAILARAGVGFLRLLDDDIVTLGNLHRQFLFNESDAEAETPKVIAAARALHAANSGVTIEPVQVRLTRENGHELVADVDLLMDGTDHFPTRFLLNELTLGSDKPLVSGGVTGTSGQVMTVIPGQTPCLGCVFDPALADVHAKPGVAKPFPVLSPIVQVVSAWQAMEAIKILSGHTDRMSHTIFTFDLWNNRIRQFPLEQLARERCEMCRSMAAATAIEVNHHR
ncbi:MAG: HesA/MoeB/ThiF family protein [Planctomycetaceae bacterium]|nr:HesA/MoeB/ThiF family protein [Planctomycetaceae bacterium]